MLDSLIFFFFQAEDGIRDLTVTGVQTCALPIYHHAAEDFLLDFPKLQRPGWLLRSEEHTSELQSQSNLVCRPLLEEKTLKPGDTFKECRSCPEMVVVPAGSFAMGSTHDKQGWNP